LAGISVLVCVACLPGCGEATGPPDSPDRLPTVKTRHGEMVLVPAGWFMMGSDRGEDAEKPVHKVWVDALLIDKCEVTQEQFSQLMQKAPSHFKGPRNPVERVPWGDAAWYCNHRSRAEGLEPCYDETTGACNFRATGYRLPTEVEWEYACRAGTSTDFGFGDDARKLGDHGWFDGNAGKRTHPVGMKKPNRWGIHDMHGNVMEWCNDVYEADYYQRSPERDARGPADSPLAKFVLRGGAWHSSADACRSAYRLGEFPAQPDACFAHDDIGFRCVRSAPAASQDAVKGDPR
jgi:formylglycine-generating enzyme required for sulfatase activity